MPRCLNALSSEAVGPTKFKKSTIRLLIAIRSGEKLKTLAYLVLGVLQILLGHVARLDSLDDVVLALALMPRHVDLAEGATTNGLYGLVNVHYGLGLPCQELTKRNLNLY